MKSLLIFLLMVVSFNLKAECYKVSLNGGYSNFIKENRWSHDTKLDSKFDVDFDTEAPQIRKHKDRKCSLTGTKLMVCNMNQYGLYLSETWFVVPEKKLAFQTAIISGGESNSQVMAFSGTILGKCTEGKNGS